MNLNEHRQYLIQQGIVRPDQFRRTDRGVSKLHGKASKEAAINARKNELKGKK